MTEKQTRFYRDEVSLLLAQGTTASNKQLTDAARRVGLAYPPLEAQKYKLSRGLYDIAHLKDYVAQAMNNSSTATAPDSVGGHTIIRSNPMLDERTDEEIEEAIDARFNALDRMGLGMVDGEYRSIICSGNAGTGKTYALEYVFGSAHDREKIKFTTIHGYVKPTGIFKLLYENRFANCVIMFDDADSVFQDEIGLNILKAALDTTKRRHIAWHSEKIFELADGEILPKEFDYEGAVVFVSNLNFDALVKAQNKLTPHLEALMTRSFYVDLNLQYPRELMVRIKSVIRKTTIIDAYAKPEKLEKLKARIIAYMDENVQKMRDLSLRSAIKLAQIYKTSKSDSDFVNMANATCLKRT